jgi:hypothetical protein
MLSGKRKKLLVSNSAHLANERLLPQMIVTAEEGGITSDPYQRGDQSTPLVTASLITKRRYHR